jgi:serine/threonine-protein kinase HipA
MREAKVFYNGCFAGILTQLKNGYRFRYDPDYLVGSGSRSVSLTLPLRAAVYESETLFPFFVNMLSEGANKAIQVRLLKIDERDYFGLLLATAGHDSIGPITLEEII